MSGCSFHLCQMSVKFRLHKWPCRSDPGFNQQRSGCTSSLSGDCRAALPGAGGPWCPQQLLCAAQAGCGPSLLPLNHQSRQIYGTTPPSSTHTPPGLTCGLVKLRGWAAAQRNALNTHDSKKGKKMAHCPLGFVSKPSGVFFFF